MLRLTVFRGLGALCAAAAFAFTLYQISGVIHDAQLATLCLAALVAVLATARGDR